MTPQEICSSLRFAADTAAPGTEWSEANPAAGHCAAVAVIVRQLLGGEYVSATVNGQSHWYNLLPDGTYCDLTGDQFGWPAPPLSLSPIWPQTRLRDPDDLRPETLARADVLAGRMSTREPPAGPPGTK